MTIETFNLRRAKSLYVAGRTLREVADDQGCSYNTVWLRLRAAGVKMRAPSANEARHKEKIERDLIKKLTHHSATTE